MMSPNKPYLDSPSGSSSPIGSSQFFSQSRKALRAAPKDFFLDNQAFAAPVFFEQLTENIFSPEALSLKTELVNILKAMRSEENLLFLEQIHTINNQRYATPKELHDALDEIEKDFLHAESATPINISDIQRNDILYKGKASNKKLSDYKYAVREVFELIKTNVDNYISTKPQVKVRLMQLDTYAFQCGEVAALISEISKITIVPTVKLGMLKTFSARNRDTMLFSECQKACRSALDKINNLVSANDPKALSGFEKSLSKVLFEVKNKLESRVGEIQAAEIKNRLSTSKTHLIYNAILNLNHTIDKLGLSDTAEKKSRSNQVSPLPEKRQFNRPK